MATIEKLARECAEKIGNHLGRTPILTETIVLGTLRTATADLQARVDSLEKVISLQSSNLSECSELINESNAACCQRAIQIEELQLENATLTAELAAAREERDRLAEHVRMLSGAADYVLQWEQLTDVALQQFRAALAGPKEGER